MIKALKVFLVFHTLFFLFIFHSTVYASLENSVPFKTWVDAKTIANIEFVVPDGTTKLSVVISDGSGDLDLYLKYGSPVSGGTISDIDADADIVSDGPTADETIVISPYTTPALIPGTWHIATLNLNNETTTFTLTATIETEKKLPLPDSMTSYPTYAPIAKAVTGTNVKTIKPIGVGNIADSGDTVAIEVELASPDGPYDAYFALHAPVIAPNELFMLSQDGNLYPASKKGLVKWKQSANGSINEKPFGAFPVSLLPGGNYNLYFLLTTADSLDAYYLWNTYFDAPENIPDGSAGFFNGTLVVPNATILYQGQEFQESAPIPSDALVSIFRDGKTYLYHPDLGKTKLSEDMTRRAVGRFIIGPVSTLKSQSRISAAPSASKLLKVSGTETLATGIALQRKAEKVIKIINNQNRWIAVKSTDGSGPYFIPPRSRTIDNNVIRMFFSELNLNSSWFNTSKVHEYTFSSNSDDMTIETYGAAWRPLAYFIEGTDYIADILYYYFKGQTLKQATIPVDGMELRRAKDAALGEALDKIDMAYMILEGIKSFYSAADISEGGEIFVNAAANFSILITHAWYSGEAGHANIILSLKTAAEDFVSDLANIGIQTASVGGATPVLTLIDLLATVNYTINSVIMHEADVLGRWVYDEIRVEPDDDSDSCVIGTWATYVDSRCTYEKGANWIFQFWVSEETGENIARVGSFYGSWTLSGNTLKSDITNPAVGTVFKFEGTIDSQCHNVTGEAIINGNKSCWFGSPTRF